MKTLILILSILLFSNITYAQTTTFIDTDVKTYSIYDTNNGLPFVLPSKTIIYNNGNYDVYENTNGLPSILPVQTIQPANNNTYNVYDLENGLPSLLPTQIIILK